MRALYLIVGFLLGLLVVTRGAEKVFEAQEIAFKGETLALMMKAYDDGWSRAKVHADQMWAWRLFRCLDEKTHK
jgi:Pyruvate/2-oxoacid:ferredoxin oxidoreductase gamma subunit